MSTQETTLQSFDSEFSPIGEALAIMAQCDLYKDRTIEQFSLLIVPALRHGQLRIWRRGGMPVGLATWANLDEETERKVLHEGYVLAPHEWNCGDRPVVMDLVAPFGDGFAIGRDLARTVFQDVAFTAARRKPDGSLRKVVQFPGRDAKGHWTQSRAFAA